jgi:hypothetical protein
MMEVRTQQSGRLEDVSPLDLLQSLGIYRRAGHVVFDHPYGRSQLWFEAGAIVDAESGALRGTAAVHRIATHDRGEYRVEVTGEPHARTIERSGSGLVFEAARRLDEGQRLRTRLPAIEVVLVRAEAAAIHAPTEEHRRVATLLEAGATLGEVLERSPLGELETLQWIAELVEAGRLRGTGVLRPPAPPASEGLAAAAPWPHGLEPASQPFVPSPSFTSHEALGVAPTSRWRWWIHATVGAAMAAAITLVVVGSRTEVAPLAAGGDVTVIDATKPRFALPDDDDSHGRALTVGASPVVDAAAPARGDRAKLSAGSPPMPLPAQEGKAAAREPQRAARSRSGGVVPTVHPEARPEPTERPADATSLLAEARRAYAAGQGATAYRLAARSQALRPTGDAAEVMTLAACQQHRPDTAAEALRAVPLLRRGSVRSTCKQAHGVRIKGSSRPRRR